MIKAIFLSICVGFLCSSLSAQTCWRHFNADSCKHHIVTEFSVSTPIAQWGNPNNRRFIDMALNLGYDRQLSQKFGLGAHFFGTIYIGDADGGQFGFRPRLAWYFNKRVEFNFAPGIILTNPTNGAAKFPGLSIESNLYWNKNLGIVSRLDWLNKVEGRQDSVHLHLGLKTRGRLGMITGLITPIASILVLIVALSNSQ